MTNSSKNKGDRGELEADKYLKALCPDLLLWDAMRMLGAGRKEDVGDLKAFPDAAVQVKNFSEKNLSRGLYEAATGAQVQASRARHPFNTGMVVVPRARKVGAVRFVASTLDWPVERDHATATNSLAALALVKKAGPNADLTVQVNRKGAPPIIIANIDLWVAAYRLATDRPKPEGEWVPPLPEFDAEAAAAALALLPCDMFGKGDRAWCDTHGTEFPFEQICPHYRHPEPEDDDA
jgi:hypothetical protein